MKKLTAIFTHKTLVAAWQAANYRIECREADASERYNELCMSAFVCSGGDYAAVSEVEAPESLVYPAPFGRCLLHRNAYSNGLLFEEPPF